MDNLFIKKLIFLIKEKTNSAELPVVFLGDVLSMGKEAAYRRLRGEIPFTFDEMLKISQRLEVSLDEIADISKFTSNSRWATFDVDVLTFPSTKKYRESYYESLVKYKNFFEEMTGSSTSVLKYAGTIPYSFLLHFKKLSLFRHYKSIYLAQEVNPDFSFEKMTISSEWLELEKQVIEISLKVPRTLIILDRNTFEDMVRDILYFFEENLVSENELRQLKKELIDLLAFIETLTKTGTHETGTEIDLYLSNINIGSSYAYMENDTNAYAVNLVYFTDLLIYQNPRICQKQEKWIELLKRFSTHITQTGERHRFEYFRKQREMIENLLP